MRVASLPKKGNLTLGLGPRSGRIRDSTAAGEGTGTKNLGLPFLVHREERA